MRITCRQLIAATVALAAIAAALTIVPAAVEASASNGLFAYVVPATRGPVPACREDGSDCGPANAVWNYIYIANSNRITNNAGGTSRETLPNSYVVTSVDSATFANGQPFSDFDTTFTPAPSPTIRSWAGHWPTTVTCQPGAPPDPCNEIRSPAVIPGENTAILYGGWSHGDAEPNGSYVFRYTIHGTLNGTPVVLTASSPPITMTP
jgi:hypothetical protein